jgi:hypothetical protein
VNSLETINDAVIFTTHKVLHACLELEFLFNDVFVGIRVSTDLNEAISARSIVYLEYDFDINVAKAIKNEGKRLVLMHLGDETAIKDLTAYVIADVVFRNYFHESIFDDPRWRQKIHWMPNGYRNGLRLTGIRKPKPVSERKQLARFIGWLSNPNSLGNERAEFEQAVHACGDMLQCIPTQGFAGGFSAHLYQHLMEDSIFAPCPAGNAAETIRLFDALECGCIPISRSHGFITDPKAFRNDRIILIESWLDLPLILNKLKAKSIKKDYLDSEDNSSQNIYWRRYKLYVGTLVQWQLFN